MPCFVLFHICCSKLGVVTASGISGLVMSGDVGGSIAAVEELYPTLLKDNPNLLFLLKVQIALSRIILMVCVCLTSIDSRMDSASYTTKIWNIAIFMLYHNRSNDFVFCQV